MKVTYIDHMGSDLSVVNAARVSFKKHHDEFDGDKDAKLIRFLAREKHLSPFNHTFITLHVKAPIFVARQLVKHEYMPWNEVSRRYVTEEIEFYEPEMWRKKAPNVKQGSSDEEVDAPSWCSVALTHAEEAALDAYYTLLNEGVCPEQARMVLPQSVYTEWYWSGTLGAYAKMLGLRLDSHTQCETQEIARQAYQIIEPLFPVSTAALLTRS